MVIINVTKDTRGPSTKWGGYGNPYVTTLNIVTQQNFVVASWSNMLQQIELASTFFNKIFQLATTKFCCVTTFETRGNMCNNAFQLATQQCCIASCCNLLLLWLHLSILCWLLGEGGEWELIYCDWVTRSGVRFTTALDLGRWRQFEIPITETSFSLLWR